MLLAHEVAGGVLVFGVATGRGVLVEVAKGVVFGVACVKLAPLAVLIKKSSSLTTRGVKDRPSWRNNCLVVIMCLIACPCKGIGASISCCVHILLCRFRSSPRHSSAQKIRVPSLLAVGEVR